MDLKKYIRDVANFPKPGVIFKDITPLLKERTGLKYVVEEFAKQARALQIDAVVGIESRGFIFGSALAYALALPFIPVRKPGKLPSERMSVEYSLEYDTSQLDIHKDALKAGQKVAIVDDVLATGGTARAAAKLVELLGAKVSLMLFVIELKALKGFENIKEYNYQALLKYD